MNRRKTCVVIPTLNESGTISTLCKQVQVLVTNSHILVIDDSSSDGTIEIVQNLISDGAKITLVVRPSREGIGSAHKFGLRWALKNEFDIAITMDADLTHDPKYIPVMISQLEHSEITIASRFVSGGGLEDWTMSRTFMTHLGHFLTRIFLKVPFDASSGFRAYRLSSKLVTEVELVASNSYSFLVESLALLVGSKFSINEIPVVLPSRTYGNSKMRLLDATETLRTVITARRLARKVKSN